MVCREEKLHVVIFSGGRGTATIAEALQRHPQVELTVLINGYDDGKSTGEIRRFIPGMLGPSDFRKTIGRLIPGGQPCDQALARLIEYRLPVGISDADSLGVLEDLANAVPPTADGNVAAAMMEMRLTHVRGMAEYCSAFLNYYRTEGVGRSLTFADCGLGNILFAGCFLLHGRDFNATVHAFAEFCRIGPAVLNITDGQSLVLVGLKESGQFLHDEASIVSEQDISPLADIYLLEDYLSEVDHQLLAELAPDARVEFLTERQVFPEINPDAAMALTTADLIIYGPGTQHSSQFPSYLTQSVGELIASNVLAEKVFVGNIAHDHEIQGETANSLLCKLARYLNLKGKLCRELTEFNTVSFLQAETSAAADSDYVAFSPDDYPFRGSQVVVDDWSGKGQRHLGGRVLDELIRIAGRRLRRKLHSMPYMVSIIVPGRNEQRTVAAVLEELTDLDFHSLGMTHEVIYVDGGSTDASVRLARSVEDVHVVALSAGTGRGAALRRGVEAASGNIIAFFPSDAEYSSEDLVTCIEHLVKSDQRAVFGSRTARCLDLAQTIRRIYGGRPVTSMISKYGGMLLSMTTVALYNRYISDLLTGIKVFNAGTLRSFNLTSNSVALEGEIVAKAAKTETFVLEVPVDYFPRTREQGKKITVLDGLKTLAALAVWKFSRFSPAARDETEDEQVDVAAAESWPRLARLPVPPVSIAIEPLVIRHDAESHRKAA